MSIPVLNAHPSCLLNPTKKPVIRPVNSTLSIFEFKIYPKIPRRYVSVYVFGPFRLIRQLG